MSSYDYNFVGITVHVDCGNRSDLYPGHPLLYIERDTIDLVRAVGLVPYLIPIYEDRSLPPLDHVSSLILTGGGYLDLSEPNNQLHTLYSTGEERYEAEKKLIHYGLTRNLPMVGICRGAQMINEVLGGRLDNIPDYGPEHHQERLQLPPDQSAHKINVISDSTFFSIARRKEMSVNSFHRQHMSVLGEDLRPVAFSEEDGLVEIYESTQDRFLFGFQFHPEKMWRNNNVWSAFFNEFATRSQFI